MLNQIERLEYKDKEIILIPTAHVSQESVELVKKVIDEEIPDSVCIELDENRFENIKNPKQWEQTDIIKVIKNHRVGFMLANLALSSYQNRLAEKLGTVVGGEMLQGIKSAEEINAEIVLADRDIQVTFKRIWRKLNLWEKAKLLFSLIFSFEEDEEGISEESFEDLMQKDMLEAMLLDMKKEFPKIVDILIDERDQYLSHKIKNAPGKKVVAVLGSAHVPGIMKKLNTDIQIENLVTVPKKRPTMKILSWAIPILIIALIVYGFVTQLQTGIDMVWSWVLWNSCLSALFTLIAGGHILSVLTSLVVAPFTSLNPVVAAGWFSGLVQAHVKKPRVKDLHDVKDDIFSVKSFFKNRLLKVLIVVIMANIGSSIGTFVAGANIIKHLF